MSTETHIPNRYKLFAVGAIGTFMGTLDGSIMNVALPTLSDKFGAGIDLVAWVALAYALTTVSLLLVFGAWTENKGYGFAYKFAYLFFIGGSILCALSTGIYSLIAGRVVQAVGAAMFQAVGAGMVSDVFPRKERGKGIGMMVMMVSAGLMFGPPIGGFMLSYFSWQWLFLINIPLGLVGLYMANRYFSALPPRGHGRETRLVGAITLSLGLFCFMLGLSIMNDYSITDWRVLGLWLISLISAVIFTRYESQPKTALIGIEIFRNRQFSSSVAAMLAVFISLAGAIILVPFYLERIKGLEPKSVGMYLVILPVLMFMIAPVSGRLSDKIGFRFLTSFGITVYAFGIFMLSWLTVDSTPTVLIVSLGLMGLGQGIFGSPNSSAFMGSVKEGQRAITSGILSATRNIGMSVGIALATSLFTIFEARYVGGGGAKEAFMNGYHIVALVSFAIALLGLPFCFTRANRAHHVDVPAGM
ncbi:MAG: MFS transporter [Candidatus Zixiibacteriota bacterium]